MRERVEEAAGRHPVIGIGAGKVRPEFGSRRQRSPWDFSRLFVRRSAVEGARWGKVRMASGLRLLEGASGFGSYQSM
jgi:hypothetical protein